MEAGSLVRLPKSLPLHGDIDGLSWPEKKVPPKRKRPGIRLPAAYRPFGLSCCELPHPNLGLNHEKQKAQCGIGVETK
jgi:hypothetical protein